MIAIKGLEMPKDCQSCPFVGGAAGICEDKINYTRVPGHRLADCPLREVGKLCALQIVNQEYSEGIHWAKEEAVRMIVEKLYADGCIRFETRSAQSEIRPLLYDPCHPGDVEVLARLTVVMPEGGELR